MKVGKESIAGAMAALEAWAERDHAAVRALRAAIISSSGWSASAGCPGLAATIVPDPTDNPLDRLVVRVDPRKRGPRPGRWPRRWPPAIRR